MLLSSVPRTAPPVRGIFFARTALECPRMPTETPIPACPACGYNLRGAPDARCPECGRAVSPDEAERAGLAAGERWRSLRGATRLTARLWGAMALAVLVLWLFEGQGVIEWLAVGVVSVAGVLAAATQGRCLARAQRRRDDAGLGPGRLACLTAETHLAVSAVVVLPVLGMAFLLLAGAALGALLPG